MNGTPRKRTLGIIGLVLFVAIAVVGIILELIKKAGGWIAIPVAAAAFVILGIFLGIEDILRKRELKANSTDFDDPFELNSEQQFLRHTDLSDDYYQNDADTHADYDEVFDDEADELFDEPPVSEQYEPAEADEPAEQYDDPGSLFRRRRAAAEQAPEPEYDPEPEEPAYEAADEPEYLKPVMVLNADKTEPVSEPEPEEPYFDEPEEEVLPEPAAPVAPAAPVTPAAPAAPVAAPVVADTAGQSLESFYADMSEEDILFRDCVEVWAADAKPCMLKLLKYVESIEDKQTQAAFGRECEYINAMLDRITFFNQLEYIDQELEPARCNFSSMVKECLKRFSPFFMEKRLGLLWKGLDIDAMIDRKWFIFALTQVIFNCVEFTPEGGKIAISAKKNGNYVDLMVDDSGCGISKDEMPYVLMAGFMGDDAQNDSGRRTGMGLFIARSVVVKMGGDLYVESNNGRGTRVTFHLPTGM